MGSVFILTLQMLKLRHREVTQLQLGSWDVNLGSLVSESVLLASTLWSCFHTWLLFEIFLIAEYFKWAAVCIDFAYSVLIFLLILLIGFSFSPLSLEISLFMVTTDFVASTMGYFSFLFLLDLFLAFGADTHLYGIPIDLWVLTYFVFLLPHWASLIFFTLFPSPSLFEFGVRCLI